MSTVKNGRKRLPPAEKMCSAMGLTGLGNVSKALLRAASISGNSA